MDQPIQSHLCVLVMVISTQGASFFCFFFNPRSFDAHYNIQLTSVFLFSLGLLCSNLFIYCLHFLWIRRRGRQNKYLKFKCSVILRLLGFAILTLLPGLKTPQESNNFKYIISFSLAWFVVPDYAARKALWQNSPLNKVITPIRFYILSWTIALITASLIILVLNSIIPENSQTELQSTQILKFVIAGLNILALVIFTTFYKESRVRERLLNFLYVEFQGKEKELKKKSSQTSVSSAERNKARFHGSLQLFESIAVSSGRLEMNVDTPLHTAVSKQRQQIIENDYNLELYLEEIEKSLGSSPIEDDDHSSGRNSQFSISKNSHVETEEKSQKEPSKKYSEVIRGNTPPDTTNREVEMMARHKTTKSNDANASQLNLIREKRISIEVKDPEQEGALDFDHARGRISSTFPIKNQQQEQLQDSPPIEIEMPEPPSGPQIIQVKNLHITQQSFQGSARQSIGTVTPPPQGAIAMPLPIKETEEISQLQKPKQKEKSKRLYIGTCVWLFLIFLDCFGLPLSNYLLNLNYPTSQLTAFLISGAIALTLTLLCRNCLLYRFMLWALPLLPLMNIITLAPFFIGQSSNLSILLSAVHSSALLFLLPFQILMSDRVLQKFNQTKENSLKNSGFLLILALTLSLLIKWIFRDTIQITLGIEGTISVANFIATVIFLCKVGHRYLFEFFKQKQLQKLKSNDKSVEHEVQENQSNGATSQKLEDSGRKNKKNQEKKPMIYSEF